MSGTNLSDQFQPAEQHGHKLRPYQPDENIDERRRPMINELAGSSVELSSSLRSHRTLIG